MPTTETQPALVTPAAAAEYWIDAWQRSILFLDVMRQRAAQNEAHAAEQAPHVLDYKAELVVDGRRLDRPVNYLLVRILPPADVVIDPKRRPFVVFDPRAGHGPGIGGFKADSEIGVAMKAGHPAYFVGFLPDPVPGQTILDIANAEAAFLEEVIARHPDADGKPCVIGNCQAGWAVMLVAAQRPELFGPIILAGTPLSYWAGVRGQYPMRYSGGLLGGSWLTALTGDLGAGIFDGASLVQNFENQNPANTLWTKQYNLWSRIDTEPERYLDFEKWWGGHITLNAEEMQWIVDELFVGNHLAAGEIRTPDGTAIDLRIIRSPIVVFCSKGDNITPPQQALDWILDLYDSVDDIRAHGQTIVYTVHEKVGHLGIFVSGGVAKKEHDEFASNIDLIDVLPPGLYEAVLTPKGEAVDNPDLVSGQWVMRCEARTLDDIRALGCNALEDERKFAAAARLSEINLALYRTFAQPLVRAAVTPQMAEAMRRLNPLRLSYEMFGARNPFLAWVDDAAEQVRAARRPSAPGNPMLALQEQMSKAIVDGLEAWRKTAERLAEDSFHAVYGTPALQAALGVDTRSTLPPRKAARSKLHEALVARRIEELRSGVAKGGTMEAFARALVYAGMARRAVDERGFEAIRRLRDAHLSEREMSLVEFKALVREQFLMLLIDEEAALGAIPEILPKSEEDRRGVFNALRTVLEASGALDEGRTTRLQRVAKLFGLGPELVTFTPSGAGQARKAS
jgi:pimeloyl-ACP methyl ester carboxylesterase